MKVSTYLSAFSMSRKMPQLRAPSRRRIRPCCKQHCNTEHVLGEIPRAHSTGIVLMRSLYCDVYP